MRLVRMALAWLVALVATAFSTVTARAAQHAVPVSHVHPVHVTSDARSLGAYRVSPSTTPAATAPSSSQSPQLPSTTELLIGVKSTAVGGFENRQTIRQTWANPAHRPVGVSVVFLGCEPDWTSLEDPTTSRRTLENEKAEYGDLLTHELHCVDSYETLVEKVKGFFHWVHATPEAPALLAYVMVTDDDVYIDVQALMALLFNVEPPTVARKHFYGGQVLQKQFDIVVRPLRDPHERNHLPVEAYPLSEKPHFATGAHYLLSMDLACFLGRNSKYLEGVGTLEDVSIGLWLSSLLGVHPVYMPQFDNVRFTFCHAALVAYADLSQLAMRRMHDNRVHNRSLCDGFNAAEWDKRDRRLKAQLPQSYLTGGLRISRRLSYHWDLQFDKISCVFQIVTTISTEDQGANETVVAVYTPAKDSFDSYCRYLLDVAQRKMPTTEVSQVFCLDHRAHLSTFMASAASSRPNLKHVYALAQTNIQEDADSLAVFVQLAPDMSKSRTLVECLMAAAFTGVHVAVLDREDHAARYSSISPDVVVATVAAANVTVGNRDTQAVPRMLVFRSPEDGTQRHHRPRCRYEISQSSIGISSFHEASPCHARHLYIPIASQSFARRYAHSPVALLQAAPSSTKQRDRSVLLSCLHSRFAIASAAAEVLRRALEDMNFTVDAPICDSNHSNSTLDEEVVRFSQYKFVVVIEDRLAVPGHASHQLVSAFLAGAVPIYVGHSATATWLFNSQAFVDCGSRTSSLRDCAGHVRHVADDPIGYEAMRNAPPVVSKTLLLELFSWHPDVIDLADPREQPLLLGERLRALINNA